mgnify:CR=1 FL=1
MLRGERAPKRLDPTGIGRMITTKINANIGASPVVEQRPTPRSRSSAGRSASAPTR